jgi:hypothetical protein
MKLWCFAFVALLPFTGSTQDFNSSDRFGKSAEAVVRLGHDQWVRWYCDETRRGKDGRVGAERVYCLALHEVSQPLLQQRSKADQAFFGEARSYFSDLAKTSFAIGFDLTGYSDAWSLPVAKSNTAINETIWLMLQTGGLRVGKASEVTDLASQIEDRVNQVRPEKLAESKRYRLLAERIEKRFERRPKREIALARAFMVKMGQLALWKPSESEMPPTDQNLHTRLKRLPAKAQGKLNSWSWPPSTQATQCGGS